MADELSKDQEPAGLPVAAGAPPEQGKARKTFSRARRELSEEELATRTGVVMLVDQLDRLEAENSELSQYRNRFYEADTECAVLKERSKESVATDVIFGVITTLGGAALGASAPLWQISKPYFYIALGFGVLLMATAIAAKALRRR